MFSAVATFTGLILVAVVPPRWWLGLLICAFLLFGYALDSADGQLARLTGGGSKSGEWLDHVVDATKVAVLHTAVLVSFYRFVADRSDLVLLIPLAYQVVSSVFFFSFILVGQLRSAGGKGTKSASPRNGSGVLQSVLTIPTDYATLALCFVLFGWQYLFIGVYTGLFLMNLLILAVTLLRWWREMQALDRASAQ